MKARLERIMEQYGQIAALTPRSSMETLEIRAFLQPVLNKREDPPVTVTPLGPVSEQRWVYIGPASAEISMGDRITCGEVRFAVQETQPVYWQDEVLYWRAMLRREKEAVG